jgi:ribose-phosphate pyrophosphokinase
MFYPDEGAMKRYSAMTKAPYSFGIKDRDWETGVIKGLNIMNPDAVKGKDVLIVDDICSRGGTFYHSAKALKEAGANKIYLYVTHLETTVFDGDLINSDLVEQIYTTDSIFPEDKKTDLITILKP